MSDEYLIFSRRTPINGKYPISDGFGSKEIVNHEEFFIFKLSEEQWNQIKAIGYDCININLLREHNPDSTFLVALLSDEIKDITELGLSALMYLDYVEPPVGEQ